MRGARLWRRAGPPMCVDDDRSEKAAVLGGVISRIVQTERYDQALKRPKLLLKGCLRADTPPEVLLRARSMAAQIG